MEVTLEQSVPLFRLLADVCTRVEARDRRLRLVGGTAMLLWGRSLARPRDMTLDLDCVILESDVPDPVVAGKLAEELIDDIEDLGFERETDWRASRKGRFSYPHREERVAVEFLCGDLSQGRRSRRKPAWKLASLTGGPPHFYAAHVPWLDFVDTWVEVSGSCGSARFALLIPDLAGLTVLKIRAAADKTRRIDDETDPQRAEYERSRLERHAGDCVELFRWLDDQGQFDRLVSLALVHSEVRSTARDLARWMLDHPDAVRDLQLEGVAPAVMRIVA